MVIYFISLKLFFFSLKEIVVITTCEFTGFDHD